MTSDEESDPSRFKGDSFSDFSCEETQSEFTHPDEDSSSDDDETDTENEIEEKEPLVD